MNSPEIERLVTTALRTEAEDAMNQTNTTARLEELMVVGERDARDRRRRRTVVAVAATAAVVLTIVALSWPGGDDRTAPPAGPPTRTERITEAEQVATGFTESLAAFDRTKAASYVASGTFLGLGGVMNDVADDGWSLRNRWDQATGWKVTEVEGCHQVHVGVSEVRVRCAYAAHQLGSERLGRGPFRGNLLDLTVRDGEIVGAVLLTAHDTNGFSDTMWNPFWTWMGRTHPGDEPAMAAFEEPGARPARVSSSLRLWHQRVQEYVVAVRAGRAR